MRQAVVLIHGIGEQKPMDTLRGFVDAVIEDKSNPKADKFYNRPDRVSELHDLRVYRAKQNNMPQTDFYEFYWAHLLRDTTWSQVLSWIWDLLRRPTEVPFRLLPIWLTSVILLLGFLYFLSYGLNLSQFNWMDYNMKMAGVCLFFLLLFNRIILTYLGDAARYLSAKPENVAIRQKIRAEGIKLLRSLNDSGHYDRIIVIGHSLGSVIAYDVLKQLWSYYDMKHDDSIQQKQPKLRAIERFVAPSDEIWNDAKIDQFQKLQQDLWQEQKQIGNPWLITDLVTLGSHLSHAALLMARSKEDLKKRQKERELPTCPPTLSNNRFSFDRSSSPFSLLHHAALFAPTRWTNIYFFGDFIGGNISKVFGRGVKDIRIKTLKRPYSFLPHSHTKYWKKDKAKLVLAQVVNALNLKTDV